MTYHPFKLTVAVAVGSAMLLAALSQVAHAQNRPQGVRDLIAGHAALAMKIRPLHDRVLIARPKVGESAGFKPDGVPLRAKVGTTSGKSGGTEARVPERLRHKDRAATSADEYGRLKVQFLTLEKKAKAERERVNRPDFGVGLRGASNIAAARKALAGLQREFAAIEEQDRVLRKKPGRTTYDPR